MKKNIAGLSLIELVIVIIILGLLAAVAIPKFIDLSGNAKASATKGVAADLSTANAANYSARKANSAKGVAIANCTDVARTLQEGLPKGYTITSAKVAVDATVTCTLTGPESTTATFSATGIS